MICTNKPKVKINQYNYIQNTGDNYKEIVNFIFTYYGKAVNFEELDNKNINIITLISEWGEWFEGCKYLVKKNQYIVIPKKNKIRILSEEEFNNKYDKLEGGA